MHKFPGIRYADAGEFFMRTGSADVKILFPA